MLICTYVSKKIGAHNTQLNGDVKVIASGRTEEPIGAVQHYSLLQRYLYELINSVKVIIGTCSLLWNKAFLKAGESTVHVMLQTCLKNRNEKLVNKVQLS